MGRLQLGHCLGAKEEIVISMAPVCYKKKKVA